MKNLYSWLHKEIEKQQTHLEDNPPTDHLSGNTITSTKEFLNKSQASINKLLEALNQDDVDLIKLISLLAKLKSLEQNKDEDDIFQEMMVQMMVINGMQSPK